MLISFADSSFQPMCTPIGNCEIATIFNIIRADCTITGFQMIAQLSNSSAIHKLYISNLQSPMTVEVEESGIYWVAIIPTENLGSSVECMEEVIVISSGVYNLYACTY